MEYNVGAGYSVGALMYCPANNKGVVEKLKKGAFGTKFSLAFCLEDTIADDAVEEAEEILVQNMKSLNKLYRNKEITYLPNIFIRVRKPSQIYNLVERLGKARGILLGFCLPKFDDSNALNYLSALTTTNKEFKQNYYIMPILESHEMVDLRTRYEFLYRIKGYLDKVRDNVLNVRVGGNDLSHLFALRRHSFETVYDIKPVADILVDILTVFSQDYVVSGAVWEYYNGENWDKGLMNELQKDITAGFVGKTVIHPKQIGVVNEACKVLKEDYEDAKAILNWDKNSDTLVKGSNLSSRMNEYKTHSNWAKKILAMATYYGTK